MKKTLSILVGIASVFMFLGFVDAVVAAPYPPALGGTGTTVIPSSGMVPIGNGAGTYTPAYILCAGTCQVTNASGSITITGTGVATNTGNWAGTWQLYNPSDFLSSSTQKVISVNGLSGVVTITSSTLGVVWPTVNGNQATNYNIVPGTGVTSTVSGATTTITIALNNGSTQNCSANQFVNSITGSGIVNCGTITFPTAPTYTFVAGAGISLSQATSTTNTTTTITNTGVLSLQSSTQVIVSAPTGPNIQLTLALNYLTAALLTLNGMSAPNQAVIAGTGLSYSTSTSGSNATTTLTLNINNGSTQTCSANQFVNQVNATGITSCGTITFPAAISSINGATSSAQTITGGTGISVSTTASSTNSTTTVTNTGVTSFTGTGCVTAANSTGSVALAVTCISGNQNITFTISGDATGTASGATAITDSITVTGLNGKVLPANTTGTLQYSQGAWAINLATSSLGQYDANGKLTSYVGSSCGGGQYVTGFSATGAVACGTPSGSATTTINGAPAQFTFTPSLSGSSFTITSSTSNGSSTITFTVPANLSAYTNNAGFLTAAILSINGMTNANHAITCASGCSIATSSSGSNATTSITINFPSQVATTTITASGTTLNGNVFTFGSTSIMQPYVSGTSLYWNFVNPGFLSNASITTTGPITWSGGNVIGCATCIATNTGNWAGTWQGVNSSTFLTSSTGVSSLTGTTGQVNVSNSTGSVTLSTPQNINTTSSPTFNSINASGTINASTSITINGVSVLTTSPSSLNINSSTIFIPNQAYLTTYGCPFGFSGDHTLDTCVNDLYNNNSSTASSTDFYLANGTYTWTDPTGFKWTNPGEQAQLHCAAGDGTRLVDNAATGTIGTIAWGTVPTAGAGVFGCAFFGANTVATTSANGGVIGWLVNAPYVTFRDDHFTQFSIQIFLNTNTYLNTIENNYFGYAGYAEIYAPNSGNSGESNALIDNTLATLGNSTTSHCVYLNTQSTNISGKSNDACTIEVGGLAHVSMSGVHHETINASTYGAYYPVKVDAGGVLTEVNGDYQQDGTGANVASGFITNAGVVHESNAALWASPSSTPNFIVNTGAGTSTQVGTDNTNSPGTTIANNISQFTNDAGYITTSTNNFGGLTNSSVTASNPILWSTTSTISCPTCLATNTGNWAGTWQGVNSSTFYPASNPNGYITTSTFNATGTGNYFPQWNASGNALTATSGLSTVVNNGSRQVGVNGTSSTSVDAFYVKNSSTSGDVQIELQNTNSGNGAYVRVSGASNYVSLEEVGTGIDWKIGQFGSTNFSIFDGTNSKTIVTVTPNGPNNTININATGNVQLQAPSSTITLGTASGTSNPGCVVLWDASGVGGKVYEYASSSAGSPTKILTYTKPNWCQ